jgi:hypothetical protein
MARPSIDHGEGVSIHQCTCGAGQQCSVQSRARDMYRQHHECIGPYGQAALSLVCRSPVAGLSDDCRQAGTPGC